MFNKFKLKYSHLIITIFITLNIIFLAIVASNPFFASKSSLQLHAAPNCQASGNLSYYASVAVVIKTTNSSVPLPNSLNLSMKTSTCSNGWDNGIAWEPNYIVSHQDAMVKSTDINPGNYINSNQILSYHKSKGRAPTTYQEFPTYAVGSNLGSKTLFSCGSGYGCSLLNGRVVRTVNSSSKVTMEYIQILDCAFSPETYSLSGLPSGWTQSGGNNTVNLANGSGIPSFTITLTPPVVKKPTPTPTPTPPTVPAPKQPTITVAQSCHGTSWSVTNYSSSDKLGGYLITSTNQDVYGFAAAAIAESSGTYSGYLSTVEKINQSYKAKMWVDYTLSGSNFQSTYTTGSFNYYNCIKHTTPTPTPTPTAIPTLSPSLDCRGLTWSTTNFATGDTINALVKEMSGTVVNQMSTQYTASGRDNDFVSALSKSNQNFYAVVVLGYGKGKTVQTQTSNFNFTGCTPPPTTVMPTITVSLDCNGLSWSTTNFASGDSITGYITDTTTNAQVATIPTENSSTGTYNSFVQSLESSSDSYVGVLQLSYNGATTSATSQSFNFSTCVVTPPPTTVTPTITVSLDCNGLSWSTTNFASGDSITGYITDTTTNAQVATIPTENSSTGTYNSFVQNLENSQNNYTGTVQISYNGETTSATSQSYNFYNCTTHTPPPATPTIEASLNCKGLSWSTTNFASGDSITGYITDTTTNAQVATIPTENSSTGTYNSFVQSLENSSNSYVGVLQLSYNGATTNATSPSFNFYNCTTHLTPPVLNTVTLSCITGQTNLTVGWTYNTQDTVSGDMFNGTINDTTTNTNAVATFSVPVSQMSYVWSGANTTDQYEIVGYIQGSNGKSNSITSSTASIQSCITPQVPVMSSISLTCENNTTNNLTIQWQANNITNSDTFNGVITDTTTGQQVYDIPTTPAQLGEYIWQGANGQDSYTITGWLENSSGQKFNVTTSVTVSSNCIPQKPVTPIVEQQLPQTAGGAPINVFVMAGLIILSIGVSMMVF